MRVFPQVPRHPLNCPFVACKLSRYTDRCLLKTGRLPDLGDMMPGNKTMRANRPFRSILLLLPAILAAAVCSSAVGKETGIDPATLPGLVQDDTQAVISGTWTKSVHTKPFLGEGYLYA